jgi:hypothetical protein
MEKRHTCDAIDQLTGNGSLATTTVFHLKGANHVFCILRCIIHGISAVMSQYETKTTEMNELNIITETYRVLCSQA